MSKCLLTIAGAILAVSAWPSVAAQPNTVSVAVPMGDLDLSSDAGRNRLDRRIDAAVRFICGEEMSPSSLVEAAAVRRCRTGALASVDPSFRHGEVMVAQLRLR